MGAVFGVDIDGSLTFLNQAASSMLGYQADKVMGQPVHELIHHSHEDGSFYDSCDCPMKQAFSDGIRHLVDDEVLWRKDGSSFPVEYSATPILRKDVVVGAVVVFRDITERKQMERELLNAKEAAEAATKAKGDF